MLGTLALGTAGLGGCDDDDPVLPFVLYTPAGQDTFAGVAELRVAFGDKEKRVSLSSPDERFEIELELPVGKEGVVLFEGLDGTGEVVCRGRSPEILSTSASEDLTLYVARLGSFGEAPVTAPAALTGLAAGDYRVEDWNDTTEDVTATLFFGGITASGTPLQTPFYYDSYFHETYDLEPMPSARSELNALNIDSGYFLLFGGRDAAGDIVGRLDLLMPSSYAFEYQTELDYGLEDTARAGAPAVTLGPYPSLLEGVDLRLMNSFLVVGGEGPAGPRCDAIHLVAKYSTTTYGWSVDGERVALESCRQGHTATVTEVQDATATTTGQAELVVLVYGGGETGDPVAETLRLRPTQVDVDNVAWNFSGDALPDPGPMVTGHAAVTLADGRILVLGGQTADGTVLADGWLYDPADDGFTVLPELLATPRHGHTAMRVGHELVVVGGTGGDGAVLDDAEIIDLSADPPGAGTTVPLTQPRTHHRVFRLPTGNLGVIGGRGPSGLPLQTIELYTPGAL
jgi:hypothetical protein